MRAWLSRQTMSIPCEISAKIGREMSGQRYERRLIFQKMQSENGRFGKAGKHDKCFAKSRNAALPKFERTRRVGTRRGSFNDKAPWHREPQLTASE
jgi:hypothetical protein